MKQPLYPVLAVAPAVAIGVALGARQPASALVWGLGCGLGHALVRSGFGFASGYRRLIERRDPHPVFAQLLLVALLVIAMALVLALEPLTGLRPKLLATPLSLPFLVGAFLFGIGMERARACGCGTLAATSRGGGGVLAALIGLIVGAFLGTLHAPQLAALPLPRLPSPVGLELFGLPGALTLQLAFIALITLLLARWSGQLPWRGPSRRLYGLYGGAIAVALLATGLLLVTAEPWRVLWGLALSGAHAALAVQRGRARRSGPALWRRRHRHRPGPLPLAGSGAPAHAGTGQARLRRPADGLRRAVGVGVQRQRLPGRGDELQPARLDLAGGGLGGLRRLAVAAPGRLR